MADAALTRDRRREEDDVGKRAELSDKRFASLRGQMLGDLYADSEIEPPLKLQGTRQVVRQEAFEGNAKRTPIEKIAVDADHVLQTSIERHASPRTRPAAHVDNRSRPELFEQRT